MRDQSGKSGAKINNSCNELIKGLQRFNLLECSHLSKRWRSRFNKPNTESRRLIFFSTFVLRSVYFFGYFFVWCSMIWCFYKSDRCFNSIKKQCWRLWNCEYLRLWGDSIFFQVFFLLNAFSHCIILYDRHLYAR